MKTILYATDYSKNSVTALKYAYHLALKLDAILHVIHVYNYPTVFPHELEESVSYLHKSEFEKHTLRIKYFCEKYLGDNLENINMKAVKNKSILDGVLNEAKIVAPIFIVVGSKGLTNFKHIIMGNTTKRLIEKSTFPILSIPKKKDITDLKTIVYATDFEEDDVDAIFKLANIAEPLNAEIMVIHVSPKIGYPDQVQMEQLEKRVNDKIAYENISFDVVTSDEIFSSLKIYADNSNADLIAMLDRNDDGFFKNLFNKDTVQKMKDYDKYPLISFKRNTKLKLNSE